MYQGPYFAMFSHKSSSYIVAKFYIFLFFSTSEKKETKKPSAVMKRETAGHQEKTRSSYKILKIYLKVSQIGFAIRSWRFFLSRHVFPTLHFLSPPHPIFPVNIFFFFFPLSHTELVLRRYSCFSSISSLCTICWSFIFISLRDHQGKGLRMQGKEHLHGGGFEMLSHVQRVRHERNYLVLFPLAFLTVYSLGHG